MPIPTGNHILVVPRMKESRDTMSSALFGDLLLYFCDGPATDGVVDGRVSKYLSVQLT